MMQHIYPLDDLREHELDGTSCPCGVEVDWENELVIHAAFDSREIIEQAEKLINETEAH